jgi:hypothetical protein
VTEFPLPAANTLPGEEARYAYMSTFHWMPMSNGYSGYYPPSYLTRLEVLRPMPDDSALEALLRDRVRYVIVHSSLYTPANAERVVTALDRSPLFVELGRFDDGLGTAIVFTPR